MKRGWDDILHLLFNAIGILAILGLIFLIKLIYDRYLVDELQMVLHQMNVDVATLSENYKEEVRMFGVKETCCTRCSHKDVCQYKEEYLAAQHAVDEVGVHLPTKDDSSVRSIRLRDIPWIEPVELKCRHFQQNTGVTR